MGRMLLGAGMVLLMLVSGWFWWEGHAAVNREAPAALAPRVLASGAVEPGLPEADAGDAQGADLPEAPEESREAKRFDRLDRNHDGRITREEMLMPRVKAFKKLDQDGNNLLTFDEWAVKTSDRFKAADTNTDGWLSRQEFAAAKPTHKAKPKSKVVTRCE